MELTVRVLSDIEFAEDNDRFISQVSTMSLVFWMFGMSYANCPVSYMSKTPKATKWSVTLGLRPERFRILRTCRSRIRSRLCGSRVA